MDMEKNWKLIKETFNQALESSSHCALATVNEDGSPHLTPIGSVILGKVGHGLYFEKFTTNMPNNFKHNKQVCVLAVNSSKWLWIKAILLGRFSSPPAMRLVGKVGEPRAATEREIKLWQKRVGGASWTKGYALMWSEMSMVRDIYFTQAKPIHIGKMTANIVYQ